MHIHQRMVELVDKGRPFAAALVLAAEGSAPQVPGARAAVEASGRVWGTVGGGAPEAEVVRRTPEALSEGRSQVVEVALLGERAESNEPICGGLMRILLDPDAQANAGAYRQAAQALAQRRRGLLLTTLGGEPTHVDVRWLPEDGLPQHGSFPAAEDVAACLAKECARLFADPATGREVLVEPVLPAPVLLVAGGGHIGQALARQAALVGFDVTVIDDRPEFTDPALFPEGVRARYGDAGAELAACDVNADTSVVIVTRGHRHDAEALAAVIGRPAGYVGMIGSRRKVGMMREHFLESGKATAEQWDRIFAPIGLDIGAVTVPEIAASIVAQLVAVRRKGRDGAQGGRMPLR